MSKKVNSQLEAIGSQALRVPPRPAPTPQAREDVSEFTEAESYEGHSDPKPPKKPRETARKRAGKGSRARASKTDTQTVGVHFMIPKDVHKKLKLVCLLEERTMSDVITELAATYIGEKRDILDIG